MERVQIVAIPESVKGHCFQIGMLADKAEIVENKMIIHNASITGLRNVRRLLRKGFNLMSNGGQRLRFF